MCLRASKRFELRYEPDAWVHHGVSATKQTWRYLVRVAYAIGRSRGEDSRGPTGAAVRSGSLLDVLLGAVAATGYAIGRLRRS